MVSAELLWKKLKGRQEAILQELGDGEELEAEYVSPKGSLILIRDVGYYSDNDDLIFLLGNDAASKEECQIIAQPHMLEIVFRVAKRAERPAERPVPLFRIGFHKDSLPRENQTLDARYSPNC
jgi:hypothetical protein